MSAVRNDSISISKSKSKSIYFFFFFFFFFGRPSAGRRTMRWRRRGRGRAGRGGAGGGASRVVVGRCADSTMSLQYLAASQNIITNKQSNVVSLSLSLSLSLGGYWVFFLLGFLRFLEVLLGFYWVFFRFDQVLVGLGFGCYRVFTGFSSIR